MQSLDVIGCIVSFCFPNVQQFASYFLINKAWYKYCCEHAWQQFATHVDGKTATTSITSQHVQAYLNQMPDTVHHLHGVDATTIYNQGVRDLKNMFFVFATCKQAATREMVTLLAKDQLEEYFKFTPYSYSDWSTSSVATMETQYNSNYFAFVISQDTTIDYHEHYGSGGGTLRITVCGTLKGQVLVDAQICRAVTWQPFTLIDRIPNQ